MKKRMLCGLLALLTVFPAYALRAEGDSGKMVKVVLKDGTISSGELLGVDGGVLMLQTLVEAGAWLLRVSDDFKYSMVVLREAKNVKFGHFVEPGRQLLVTVEATERSGNLATLKGKGDIEGNQTVSARLVLESYNLRDRDRALESTDVKLIAHWRDLYCLLARLIKTEQKLVH